MFKSVFSYILYMLHRYKISVILQRTFEAVIGFLIIFPISYLSKRNLRIWIFGSHIKFSGNPKYLFIYVAENRNDIRAIWISADKDVVEHVRSLGFEAYRKWSPIGLFYSLIGGVYFFSFYTVDINYFTAGKALDFNLWHGIGIKLIEFNVKHGEAAKHYNPQNIISRIYSPFLFRRPWRLLSTSQFTSDYLLKDAFRVTDEKCIKIGYPRNDIFFQNEEYIEGFIMKYEESFTYELVKKIKQFRFSYIYMPTWRETRYDFITSAGIDFDLLNKVMNETDSLFILKLHHATKLDLSEVLGFSNILILNNKIDVYEVLPFITTLITDYSSIYHDFMLLPKKQVILFPFDKEDYISANRGITLDPRLDYDTYTLGVRAYTFQELISLLKENSSDKYLYPNVDYLRKLFWGDCIENSSEMITDFVLQELFKKRRYG